MRDRTTKPEILIPVWSTGRAKPTFSGNLLKSLLAVIVVVVVVVVCACGGALSFPAAAGLSLLRVSAATGSIIFDSLLSSLTFTVAEASASDESGDWLIDFCLL